MDTRIKSKVKKFHWLPKQAVTLITNNAGETIEYAYNANGDVTSTVVKSASATVVKQQIEKQRSVLIDELGSLIQFLAA